MTATMSRESQKVYEGLRFMLGHFYCSFPRKILTAVTTRGTRTVDDIDTTMCYFGASRWEDCRINVYLDYEEMIKRREIPTGYNPKPSHLFIDMDLETFGGDNEKLDAALDTTSKNIKAHLCGGGIPTVIWSGNGYHIHQPLDISNALEDITDFAGFENPSIKFLRFAERQLTDGKSDPRHNPSFKSSLARIPGTYNSKCKANGCDPSVRIIQPWNHLRARPSEQFMNNFHAYLIQELIDKKVEKLERRRHQQQLLSSSGLFRKNVNNSMPWIDKLLQTGVEDNRKDLLYWVLTPYLINVRGLDYDQSYMILEAWLDKCAEVRRLDPSRTAFRYRIRDCLNTAKHQERKPIKFDTFKEYYPNIYKKIKLREMEY